MTVPPRVKALLSVLAVLLLSAGASYGYDRLLDRELAGYRGVKNHELERIRQRDSRRRAISGFPATRERLLQKEFGDLPEATFVRTELQMIAIGQKWLALVFGLIAAGGLSYFFFSRRRASWRRGLIVAAVLLGATQALPLLILPDDAVRLVRQFGVPLLAVCAAILAAETIWFTWRTRRRLGATAAGDH